jgi:Mlc titration factor MtfA (ptsG expression regulator)
MWKFLPFRRCASARALTRIDRDRLRDLTSKFLAAKSFDGAAGFEPTLQVCTVIALKACIPILRLGLDYYRGWSDIVVYPSDFRVHDEYVDHAGVVHRDARELCGQSLSQGPMVLSWDAVAADRGTSDRDVVIHECAHKLDILNGVPNGFPPLHANMSIQRWSRTFNDAYEQFAGIIETQASTELDSYAATDPAEFFAVTSETFFSEPTIIKDEFPRVYSELADFYRQDPLTALRARL